MTKKVTSSPDWLTRPLLIISPHYDDAMLSAFSLIGPGRRSTNDVTVLTVFGGRPTPVMTQPWDQQCGFTNSDDAMVARAAEEERAFAGLSVDRVALDLIEDQYRMSGPSETSTDRYVSFLTSWLAASDSGVVLAPAGAGGNRTLAQRVRGHIPSARFGLAGGSVPNPDHLWVTDVAIKSLPPGTRVVLYDDQPYNWVKSGEERAQSFASGFGRPGVVTTHTIEVAEKARRSAAYASQIPCILRSWARDLAAVLPPMETFWDLGVVGRLNARDRAA